MEFSELGVGASFRFEGEDQVFVKMVNNEYIPTGLRSHKMYVGCPTDLVVLAKIYNYWADV